jgi:hypothetical protein
MESPVSRARYIDLLLLHAYRRVTESSTNDEVTSLFSKDDLSVTDCQLHCVAEMKALKCSKVDDIFDLLTHNTVHELRRTSLLKSAPSHLSSLLYCANGTNGRRHIWSFEGSLRKTACLNSLIQYDNRFPYQDVLVNREKI